MVKCSIVHRLSQLSLLEWVFIVLLNVAIVHLIGYYGEADYPHVTREQIPDILFKETVPNLPKKKVDCQYEHILDSTEFIENWEVPTKYDDFDPAGIANGTFMPDCNPQFSVALLVTYRNRQKQLDIFLPYMHNFLRKQNIHYKIYVIEQSDDSPWNKGKLYNIGAKRAIADKFPCLILHDVDLLPLSASTLYACAAGPRHISATIDKFRFVLPYRKLVGGVLAIRAQHYVAVDGFSNMFQQWGGEDDDFVRRLMDHNLEVLRFPPAMGAYSMAVHAQERRNPARRRVLGAPRAGDGLRRSRPRSLHLSQHRLFTLLSVYL